MEIYVKSFLFPYFFRFSSQMHRFDPYRSKWWRHKIRSNFGYLI